MADLHQTLVELSFQNKLDVATFMHHALYHPQGYYAHSNVWGGHGDYITAPHMTQVFGEMIALWVLQTWQNDGQPHNVRLVELGPGDGTLLKDMLRTFHIMPNFKKALKTIHLVDIRAHKLSILDPRIQAHQTLEDITNGSRRYTRESEITSARSTCMAESEVFCYVFSNEFFDALPVQQHLPNGIIQHIDWKNDAWHFRYSNEKVKETCPQAPNITDSLKNLMGAKGRMLTIDYGHTPSDYHNPTLQALYRHRYVPFLSHVGQADLTCHVNFDSWMNLMNGHSTISHQGEWLLNMGAEARTQQLAAKANKEQANELWTALARLTDPAHMADLFKVWEWIPC